MPHMSKSLTREPQANILCYYNNTSSQMQIIQFLNSSVNYPSKIVFPGQRIMFEAQPDSQIEILSGKKGDTLVSQLVNCQDLQVNRQPQSKLAIAVQ